MYVYLLWQLVEDWGSQMGYESDEEVLEGVFATRKAAWDAASDRHTYRIERRKVKS